MTDTVEDVKPADSDTDDFKVRHGSCNICFPRDSVKRGDKVLSLCGVIYTARGDKIPPGVFPPDACIVCIDQGVMIEHLTQVHGMVV